ncbi:type III-A CRISPR-associated protein Csm2 [Thiorhodococcus mannitoliphagus]|uniref:CRISPR system Cms protein Csm2 n=1 Tax=Thiorhodococcus mannitoliphagus TaxID=329406 RepID=A0A6P1DXK3_9GAMM|nr:type III-A CRISPR-associated protein Csm2 [Thiorhodococcus mannitoliphagus]NEX21456.1 type III-A CRISPR-associated protein Csm2 [Thiorhodococcus mannitoliphagus]
MTNGNRGQGGGQRRGGAERGDRGPRYDAPRLDTSGIRLKPVDGTALPADLFDGIARSTAQAVAGDGRNQANKPTQLRQFYDELVMWEEKARSAPERFAELLPFIRMLNAKAAYAKGRKHVDDNFVDLIACCLGQVDDYPTLRNFKLFFEAFLGFYKQERPTG